MSKPELERYFDWYLQVIPERILILKSYVNETPFFIEWKADYSPQSLNKLGEWFCEQVGTRKLSQNEIEEFISASTFPIPTPEYQLTDKTFSLAMDIGMYLSQVLLHNFPNLQWDQPLKNKRFVHYGHAVLTGFEHGPFNPMHMVSVLAYGLAKNTNGKDGLREIYDIWIKLIE